jgi:hypothetical protein
MNKVEKKEKKKLGVAVCGGDYSYWGENKSF